MAFTRPVTALTSVVLTLFLASIVSAQDDQSDEESTWFDILDDSRSEVEPEKLELLSIQVSKLPRDTFGHGKPPCGHSFVSSFVAASGTGIYGTFEIEQHGDLVFREDLSSLNQFRDDSGTDLTENPGEDDINDFFDDNKKLSIQMFNDQSNGLFTIRGYSTPARGARTLRASARLSFLAFSQETSQTVETPLFGTSDEIEVGPLTFRVERNAGGQTLFRTGRTRWNGDEEKDWAFICAARQKPVKRIEVLDVNGDVIWKTDGLAFDGRSYTQYMRKLDAQPDAIRVIWYEQWELIIVPIEIETPLGI